MLKRTISVALTGLMIFAAVAAAQEGPQLSLRTIPTKQEPKKHHHKVLGAVMIIGGAALVGLGIFTSSRGCPVQQRAQQISQDIGQTVTAGSCGESWIEQHKSVVGASVAGTGAVLVVSGIYAISR
jgi:hypothetical protein